MDSFLNGREWKRMGSKSHGTCKIRSPDNVSQWKWSIGKIVTYLQIVFDLKTPNHKKAHRKKMKPVGVFIVALFFFIIATTFDPIVLPTICCRMLHWISIQISFSLSLAHFNATHAVMTFAFKRILFTNGKKIK